MKDYASMSDFEINKSVADIAMNGTWHVKPSHPDNDTGGWLYGSNGIQTYELPDYCNNPEDAWPIILQNRISVIFDSSDESDESEESDEWVKACVGGEEYFISYHYCHRALRAAMVAFLMMKDGEND